MQCTKTRNLITLHFHCTQYNHARQYFLQRLNTLAKLKKVSNNFIMQLLLNNNENEYLHDKEFIFLSKVFNEYLLPPIHTGCTGAYTRCYTRSVHGSKFAVFGALRLFRVRVMHACSDTVRNVMRECVARNRVWVSTPKICTTHDIVTGCRIPNKFKLFSNC